MQKQIRFFSILIFITILVVANTLNAQENIKKSSVFKDTLDGAFDISYYLYNLHGFLPVPTVITEPAVGYGGILAGAFFIAKKEKGDHKFRMPDIIALGGGYTQNKTWFTGGGYFGFWKDDHIRYRGAGGYVNVNLKYFGNGDGFLNEHPIDFNIEAYGFVQQAIFRIKETRFLFGGKYIFAKTKVTIFEDSDRSWINPKDINLTNSGLGFIAEYEHFDNIFSPNKGLRSNISYNQYFTFLGSNRNFGLLNAYTVYYLPVIEKRWSSGFRIEGQIGTGNLPFYALPFLTLRGIPAMRYQGKYTALFETEQSIMLNRRWGIVVFAGYGHTFYDNTDGSGAWNTGTGFRYLIARLFGLKMGVDIARGPEDWAVYIVFGSSWLK